MRHELFVDHGDGMSFWTELAMWFPKDGEKYGETHGEICLTRIFGNLIFHQMLNHVFFRLF